MKQIIISALLAASCSVAQAQEDPVFQSLREIAQGMPPKLLSVLETEIQKGGHANAISVCRDKAPAMAKALSEAKGVQIRRVSLKNRNPKAVPDAWERSALEDFDRQAAAGGNVALLEKTEITQENGKTVYRYMKGLPVQAACLHCHGNETQINAKTRERLQELYSDDKATGYSAGQIRGAITIKKAL